MFGNIRDVPTGSGVLLIRVCLPYFWGWIMDGSGLRFGRGGGRRRSRQVFGRPVRTVFRKNIVTGGLDHHPRGSQPREQEKTTNSRIRNELCNDKAGDYDASGASKRKVDNEEIRETGDLA
jgi:hypothetical protein